MYPAARVKPNKEKSPKKSHFKLLEANEK